VAPLLQRLPDTALEVKTVEPPAQKVLLPEMVGVVGSGVTTTVVPGCQACEVQIPLISLTE
jgi:hypothetical protein